MEYPAFSVLMSLYIKEKVEYFEQCMDSLLNQTVLPSEILIVFDGPLTKELYDKVDDYCDSNPGLISIIRNKENKGLGLALADGIPACKYDLIARMDTDDIARRDRFEIQLAMFLNNPGLDICGSQIYEFEESINNIVAKRSVPVTDKEIKKYQKKRDAFNHMTVMFKRDAVLNAGNYCSCPLMEDTYLWVRMMLNGSQCMNSNEVLVYARIGKDMYNRRGGWKYFLKYREGRRKVYKTGFITYWDYCITLVFQLVIALVPNNIRGLMFKQLLHRNI